MLKKQKFSSTKDVIDALKKLNFRNFKIVSKSIICVLVPWSEREKTMHYLKNSFPHAKYTNSRGAQIGSLYIGTYRIEVKPIEAQGNESPGILNELMLKSMVEQYLKKYKKINIVFKTEKNKTLKIQDVVKVDHIGGTNKKNIKSDLVFYDKSDEQHGISIKKDNSEFWAKIENYYGEQALAVLKKCIKEKIVKLEDHDGYFRLSSELAFKPDSKAKRDIVFGADNAKVVKRSFSLQDFKFNRKEKTLYVTASFIATTVRDLKNDNDVYCILRNDAARNSKKLGIRGLTVEGVTKRRIEGNKNLIYLAETFF